MPTYDYEHIDPDQPQDECKLGWRFERFESITADPKTECPNCGGLVQRLISGGAGFILQGGGWYKDGYGDKAPAKPEKPAVTEKPKPADPAKATEPKTYKKADN